MSTKVNLFGLLSLAIVAFLAVAAAPAQAEVVHDFESEAGNIIITGQQTAPVTFQMETSGSTVSCAASGLNGTQSSETKSWKQLTVQATFESCTLNGLSSATVDNNSCNYVISGTTDAFGHGKVQLECPEGVRMRLTLSGCTVSIGAQAFEQGAHFTKTGTGAGRDLDIKITATGGTYTSEGLFCSAYVGNGADLTVNGTYTVKAYEDKEKSEGAQIGFTINETTV